MRPRGRPGRRRREHRASERARQRVVRRLLATVEARLEEMRQLRRVRGDELGGVALERDVEDDETRAKRPGGVAAVGVGGGEELLDERELDAGVGPRAERAAKKRCLLYTSPSPRDS